MENYLLRFENFNVDETLSGESSCK